MVIDFGKYYVFLWHLSNLSLVFPLSPLGFTSRPSVDQVLGLIKPKDCAGAI